MLVKHPRLLNYPFSCAINFALLSYLINLRFSCHTLFLYVIFYILRIYLIIFVTQPVSNSLCSLRVVYEIIFVTKSLK